MNTAKRLIAELRQHRLGVRHEKGVALTALRRQEIQTRATFDQKLVEIDAEITRLEEGGAPGATPGTAMPSQPAAQAQQVQPRPAPQVSIDQIRNAGGFMVSPA